MFAGVVALRYQQHTTVLMTECHNSRKHSQSSLTTLSVMPLKFAKMLVIDREILLSSCLLLFSSLATSCKLVA